MTTDADARRIDCHVHVIDPVRFPFRSDTPYRPSGQEIAPLETLERVMGRHGVEHALLVGTNSGYGEDLSPVLDALDRGEGRFKAIAVVDLAADGARLAQLGRRGVVGIAFNTTFHGTAHYAGAGELLRRMTDLGLWLQLQVQDDQLLDMLPLIEASPVRLLVDHCGRPDLARGVEQPAFQALLALGRAGRAVVKLSGYDKFSRAGYPYADTRSFTDALVDAFGSEGCLWASDWPFLRAPERVEYASLVDLVEEILPDPETRRAVLWDTPRRIFGFGS